MSGLIIKVETQFMVEMMKMKLVSENWLKNFIGILKLPLYNLKSKKNSQNLSYDDYLAILFYKISYSLRNFIKARGSISLKN